MLQSALGSTRSPDVMRSRKSQDGALRMKAVVRSHAAWQMLPEIPQTHVMLHSQLIIVHSEAFD